MQQPDSTQKNVGLGRKAREEESISEPGLDSREEP